MALPSMSAFRLAQTFDFTPVADLPFDTGRA